MRVLTGYMPATEGRVVVAGHDVFEQPIAAKQRTGYLPETPPLYPDMTVREYLRFVAKIKGVPAADRKARVEQVMARTWVSDMAGRACGKLSKGYRQRVGLAQALIHNPEVLILDEPTAGLDPEADHRDAAADQGARRQPHHHPQHAHPAGSQPDLRPRRHHQQGPGRGRRHACESQPAAQRLGDDVRAGGCGQGVGGRGGAGEGGRRPAGRRPADNLPGAFEVESEAGRDVRRDLARAVVSGGYDLLELRPMRVSLEEIFLSLTTEEKPEEAAS